MVVVMTFGTWLITTFTSISLIAAKDLIDRRRKYEEEIKKRNDIKVSSEFKAIAIESSMIISNTRVIKQFLYLLKSDICGLFVVGAPSGSGKTSYLSEAINQFQREDPDRPVYYLSGLPKDIMKSFGIPDSRLVAEYIDKNSIIVIDQVEIDGSDEFNADLKLMLTNFATQSRNSKKFHVIIIVSKPQLMGEILKLNGGEKIYAGINVNDFQWNKNMMLQLARSLLPNFSEEEVEIFVSIFESSMTPGLLFSYASRLKRLNSFSLSDAANLKLRVSKLCDARAKTWSEFNDIMKDIDVYQELIFNNSQYEES